MSKKVTIVWDADERELPGIGIAKKGDELIVPDHVATSYIYQGLAVKPKPAKEKTK